MMCGPGIDGPEVPSQGEGDNSNALGVPLRELLVVVATELLSCLE